MNHPWDKPLTGDQTDYPIVHAQTVELPEDAKFPTHALLSEVFPGAAHSLKTWGRQGGASVHKPGSRTGLDNDPHWIGVRKQTPLHTDPTYPRYSHHLVLRSDEFSLRGMSLEQLPVRRGLYYVLDGHSPHQLMAETPESLWYIAVSMDSPTVLDPTVTLPVLTEYARTADLLPEDYQSHQPIQSDRHTEDHNG